MGERALVGRVERILAKSKRPMKAGGIAHELGVARSEVNRVLHACADCFTKDDDDYTWRLAGTRRPAAKRLQSDEVRVETLFAPKDDPIERLCELVEEAEREVLIQAFYLGSEDLKDALIEADERGVKVRVLLGRTSAKQSIGRDLGKRHAPPKNRLVLDLVEAGLDVFADMGDSNNHNKCAVVDTRIAVTGGLNFCSYAAENKDNMVVIHSAEVARAFRENWMYNRKKFGRDASATG